MYILAMIVILGGYVGLLILQISQNIDISFTPEEKAAIKAAVSNAVQRAIKFLKGVRLWHIEQQKK